MDTYKYTIIGIIAGVVLVLTATLFTASQEAKSYRKFCKTPVTTWDALWLDLRIDECN